MVDLTENPELQVRVQGLDLWEICSDFWIQGSPGLDLLEKIQTECQNQEHLDVDLPETNHIDCWSQGDQGVQRLDQHFNPSVVRSSNIFQKYVNTWW